MPRGYQSVEWHVLFRMPKSLSPELWVYNSASAYPNQKHIRDMTRPSTSESYQEVNGTEEAFRQFVPNGRPVPASKPYGPRHTNVPIRRGPTFLCKVSGIQEFSACTYRSPRTLGPSRGKIAAARWSLSHICHPGSVESVVRTRRTKKAPAIQAV
jgi:hypothetical protein